MKTIKPIDKDKLRNAVGHAGLYGYGTDITTEQAQGMHDALYELHLDTAESYLEWVTREDETNQGKSFNDYLQSPNDEVANDWRPKYDITTFADEVMSLETAKVVSKIISIIGARDADQAAELLLDEWEYSGPDYTGFDELTEHIYNDMVSNLTDFFKV